MKSSGQTRLPTAELLRQRADRADPPAPGRSPARPAAQVGGVVDRVGQDVGVRPAVPLHDRALRAPRPPPRSPRRPARSRCCRGSPPGVPSCRSYAAGRVHAMVERWATSSGRADDPRGGTRPRPNASTATSASCCRSCGWRCPASRCSSPSCSRCPFQQNFTEITSFQEEVYFATLLCTAISAVLLISPSAYHRMTFRFQQKRRAGLLLEPAGDRRADLPGAGDDRGDHADHRRPLRHRRDGRHQRRRPLTVFAVFWCALPLRRRLSAAGGGLGAASFSPKGAELGL